MLVVHTTLLRECRLAPAAVRAACAAHGRRRRAVQGHLRFVLDLLAHHHDGEDRLLWPLLDERAPSLEVSLAAVAAQHANIERLVAEVRACLEAWSSTGHSRDGGPLASRLEDLHRALVEHLEREEREVLPVAARTVSVEEWRRIGEEAVAAMPKSSLPLAFGMFAHESDPAVLRDMLSSAPALPRRVLPVVAPRLYARRARRVYGTVTP